MICIQNFGRKICSIALRSTSDFKTDQTKERKEDVKSRFQYPNQMYIVNWIRILFYQISPTCFGVLYTFLNENVVYLLKTVSFYKVFLDDWLNVLHRIITLFDLQLDAQNSYLFTYNTLIKILYMFRALTCSSSGGLRRNCIYAASGIVTLCR